MKYTVHFLSYFFNSSFTRRCTRFTAICACLVITQVSTGEVPWHNPQDRFFLGLMKSKSKPDKDVSVDKKPECSMLTVHSTMGFSGEEYEQSGIGWIIGDERLSPTLKIYVLTPAHVVAGSDKIEVQCQNQIISAQIKHIDESKDLALLEIAISDLKEISPTPLIWLGFEKRRLSTFKSDTQQQWLEHFNPTVHQHDFTNLALTLESYGLNYVLAGEESVPGTFYSWGEMQTAQVRALAKHSPLLPAQNVALLVDGLGVRPGLSGSVLFGLPSADAGVLQGAASTNNIAMRAMVASAMQKIALDALPRVLLGMIVKTEMNGSRSLAISSLDIMKYLEQALTDNASANASAVTNQQPRFDFTYTLEDGVLLRIPKLTLFDRKGKPYSIEEVCQPAYQNTSQWQAARGGGRSRGAGRRGGDYGDGGGPIQLAKGTSFYTETVQAENAKSLDLTDYSVLGVYKSQRHCGQVGLRLPDGKVIESVYHNALTYRMESLEDAYALFSRFGNSAVDILQEAAKASFDVRDFRYLLGQDSEAHFVLARVRDKSVDVQAKSKVFGYDERGFLLFKNASATESQTLSSVFIRPFSLEFLYVATDTQHDSYLVRGTSQDRYLKKLRLNISTTNGLSGEVLTTGECQIALNPKDAIRNNFWRYQLRSSQIDLDVSLNTETQFMKVSILRLSSECVKSVATGDLTLALSNFEIYLNAGAQPVIGTRKTNFVPIEIVRQNPLKAVRDRASHAKP